MLHFGVVRRSFASVELDGLVGWAVLTGAEPNATPWDHIDGLDTIRYTLAG